MTAADVPEATILHADLDSFYASVEQRDNQSLRGKPIAVGMGVVLAASYEAKAYGVRSAMPGGEARRRCPQLVVVEPRFDAYVEASRQVFDVFHNTTPLVEGLSIDEAFLEVGGLRRIRGSAEGIAGQLRADVATQVGLPITVGVARTKYLAKVASQVAKPDGLLVVDPSREREFLHPLPIERLWGVGPVTSAKLRERGITTVGDIAAISEEALVAALGKASGTHLHALAHLRDPRPVETGRRRRSIGSQQALGRRRRTSTEFDAIIAELVDRVTRRMRDAERVGRTVTLRLRLGDFSRISRAHTLPSATAHTTTVLVAARQLFAGERERIERDGLTLVGISVGNLCDADAVQLSLPFDGAAGAALDSALDTIRHRFGAGVVTRATQLGRDQGWSMPMLPD